MLTTYDCPDLDSATRRASERGGRAGFFADGRGKVGEFLKGETSERTALCFQAPGLRLRQGAALEAYLLAGGC